MRLLSSLGNTYNRDYFGETAEGHQRPMLNVFHPDRQEIRHFWGSELLYAPTEPGRDTRHVGTIEPLWNLLDLTPVGRGTDRDEQLTFSRPGQRSTATRQDRTLAYGVELRDSLHHGLLGQESGRGGEVR